MASFLKLEADSGLKDGVGGRYQVSLLQRKDALPQLCSKGSSMTPSHRGLVLRGAIAGQLACLSCLPAPPQQCQQPLEKINRKELPPEHQSLKISFEALLQRCSQSATDLVSLNLPHDAPFCTPSWSRIPLTIRPVPCVNLSYCPWTCCL